MNNFDWDSAAYLEALKSLFKSLRLRRLSWRRIITLSGALNKSQWFPRHSSELSSPQKPPSLPGETLTIPICIPTSQSNKIADQHQMLTLRSLFHKTIPRKLLKRHFDTAFGSIPLLVYFLFITNCSALCWNFILRFDCCFTISLAVLPGTSRLASHKIWCRKFHFTRRLSPERRGKKRASWSWFLNHKKTERARQS